MKTKTPITDYVKNYIASDTARLHMPGHKGKSFLGFEQYDITEIDGADVLYSADGIIKESMDIAGELFGSGKTLYSAEGSSLSVKAMLYLAVLYAKKEGRDPLIFACRNAHRVFVSSAALLDFEIKWLYGDSLISCALSADELEKELSQSDRLPCALYVTSPDYLGSIADIRGLSRVCKKYGVLLLVDNAHGAYLKFLPTLCHPLDLGADICCDSAHKTLPVLTGGGYLHLSKDAPKYLYANAARAMSLFASTSPSYLILQSLDAANGYLSDSYRNALADFCRRMESFKDSLRELGYELCENEPLKLTIRAKSYGYYGTELAHMLSEKGMICEFSDPDYLVLMLTPQNTADIFQRLYDVFSGIPQKTPIDQKAPHVPKCERVLSVREAMLSVSEEIPVGESIGRILADASVGCPPAIPVAVCGERICEEAAELFRYYGITHCHVVISDK